jgi:hypothetical protein
LRLRLSRRLEGDHLAWGYRIHADRVELAFRIAAAAFRQRNFDPVGVANRYMGLQYSARILERFYDERDGARAGLAARCAQLTRLISLETAGFLEEVVHLADTAAGDAERVERETALLGLRILRADRVWQEAMDHVYAALEDFAAGAPARPPVSPRARRLAERARHAAVGASLALSLASCRSRDFHTVNPEPPAPNGTSSVGSARQIPLPPPRRVCDPPPPDPEYRRQPAAAREVDARKQHATGATHPEAGRKHGTHRSSRFHDPPPPPPDPPPPPPDHRILPTPVCDPLPPDPRFPLDEAFPREPLAGHFRETTSGFLRTGDLPLWAPPIVHLDASPEGSGLRVRLVGAPAAISTRWEGDGVIVGSGRNVLWRPEHGPAYLRVAVRARGGGAFATLDFHG